MHKYGEFDGLGFESVDKPWFGPKKRGRAVLAEAARRDGPRAPSDFLSYLRDRYPREYCWIEWARFHDVVRRDPGHKPWRQTFAILSVGPDYIARQVLFEEAKAITAATGWYPLIMGHRVRRWRARVPRYAGSQQESELRTYLLRKDLGSLVSVQNIDPNGGTAILVTGSREAVLLDTGFEINGFAGLRRPAFAVVSHAHADHAGGALECASRRVPTLMSEGTYLQLLARQGPFEKRAWRNVYVVRPPESYELGGGAHLYFAPGAHAPGSMTVTFEKPEAWCLTYPGDLCLENAYHSISLLDLADVRPSGSRQDWMLVDAALVGRDAPGRELPSLSELSCVLAKSFGEAKSVVFAAESPEHLYALYQWFFRRYYTGAKERISRHVILSQAVSRLLETSYEYFIRRDFQRYDAHMTAVLGDDMSNYLESVRVYPMAEGLLPSDVPMPVDVFCMVDDLKRVLRSTGPGSDVFVVGRPSERLATAIEEVGIDNPVWLTGPDFSFHSTTEAVASLVRQLVERRIRPLLFHNYPKRIGKALQAKGIDETWFDCISTRPTELGAKGDAYSDAQ